MINVSLHVWYNNNSPSSAWPIVMVAIPNIGDTISYEPGIASADSSWKVVDVIHYPVSYHKEPDDDTRPSVAVHCRPSWAFDPEDDRNNPYTD